MRRSSSGPHSEPSSERAKPSACSGRTPGTARSCQGSSRRAPRPARRGLRRPAPQRLRGAALGQQRPTAVGHRRGRPGRRAESEPRATGPRAVGAGAGADSGRVEEGGGGALTALHRPYRREEFGCRPLSLAPPRWAPPSRPSAARSGRATPLRGELGLGLGRLARPAILAPVRLLRAVRRIRSASSVTRSASRVAVVGGVRSASAGVRRRPRSRSSAGGRILWRPVTARSSPGRDSCAPALTRRRALGRSRQEG